MPTDYDAFVLLSEELFREPDDYVKGLLAIVKPLHLSTKDICEAIRRAHPLPDWKDPVDGIISAIDLHISKKIAEDSASCEEILKDENLQMILSGCYMALTEKYVQSKNWDQHETERYLFNLYRVFHRIGSSRYDKSVQLFVRQCGEKLDKEAVGFVFKQTADDQDRSWANLLAGGMIEQIGPAEVLAVYMESKEAGTATAICDQGVAKDIEWMLRTSLTFPNASDDDLIRKARTLVRLAINLIGAKETERIVEEINPGFIGEFLPEYSRPRSRCNIKVDKLEDGGGEHQ